MQHFGVRGRTLKWVEDFLTGHTQQVLVDGKVNSQANVESGVPQGSVLGPLLFLVFINDLPDCIKTSTTRLFADDCVLYKRICSHNDAVQLQEDLESLQKWERTWLMQFHPAKCQVIRVTKKSKPISFDYNIHGTTLKEVSSARYLGLHVDDNLNFNTHVDIISKKANSTLAFLWRNFNHCSRKIKEMTYKAYARPITVYAVAWDLHTVTNNRKVEQVQRNSARYATGNYSPKASVSAMLNDLEWPTLQSRSQQIRLAMLYRIRFDLVDIKWDDHLIPSRTVTRGHSCRFWSPVCSSNALSSSFFPRTSREWNTLKVDPADFPTLDAFKMPLKLVTRQNVFLIAHH